MKPIISAVVIVALLLVLFIVAVATGQTALAIVPFCLWTPAIGFLGWGIGRSGLKLAVVTALPEHQPKRTAKPIQQRTSRIKPINSEGA